MKTKLLSVVLLLTMILGAVAVLSSCGECRHETYTAWENVNDEQHRRKCAECGKIELANHRFITDAGVDTTQVSVISQTCECGATREVANEDFDAWQNHYDAVNYPWEETDLKFSLSDSSNLGELESGGHAFISGDWKTDTVRTGENMAAVDSGILKQIIERNTNAASATKVKLTYDYSIESYGKVMPKIGTQMAADGTPDMYFDIIYDMVGASVKGYFANIQDNDYLGCFWDEYDAEEDSRGYLWQYMNDLTFSNKIMYLIASDFSFDLSRAYMVMPVSLKLLLNATEVTGDVNNDGIDGDEEDFYALINAGDWTWAKILEYVNAVKKEDSKKNGYALTNSDSIIGTAFSNTSGFSPTALMYTATMHIVERTVDEETGEYVYSYPDEAPASLVNAGNMLYNVIASQDLSTRNQTSSPTGTTGIVIFTGSTTQTQEVFAQNRLFVDAAIMLGCIEKKVFQDMWDEDNGSMGFAVAPVAKLSKEAEYQTLIHNIGRIFAVSKKCENVDAACAYINMCTYTSTPILEEYYEWVIGYGRAVTESNVEILMNMKNQVIYSHDKVIEDCLGLVYGSETVANPLTGIGGMNFGDCRWHIFCLKDYGKANQLSVLYAGVKNNKAAKLAEIQADFIRNGTAVEE